MKKIILFALLLCSLSSFSQFRNDAYFYSSIYQWSPFREDTTRYWNSGDTMHIRCNTCSVTDIYPPVSGSGSGVTSVGSGNGLLGGPITGAGTLKLDTISPTGSHTIRYLDSLAAAIGTGSQSLQQVTDIGSTTDNVIRFTADLTGLNFNDYSTLDGGDDFGILRLKNLDNATTANIFFNSLTTDRNYTLPDAGGTVALRAADSTTSPINMVYQSPDGLLHKSGKPIMPADTSIFARDADFGSFAYQSSTDTTHILNFGILTRHLFSATSPLFYNFNTGVFTIQQANTSQAGYLSNTDWNTFNQKLGQLLTSGNIFVGNGGNSATGVAMSGDATMANTGALTIGSNAVTFAKFQNISTGKLLGRSTAGTGNVEQLSVGTGLSLSGGTLSCTVSPGGTPAGTDGDVQFNTSGAFDVDNTQFTYGQVGTGVLNVRNAYAIGGNFFAEQTSGKSIHLGEGSNFGADDSSIHIGYLSGQNDGGNCILIGHNSDLIGTHNSSSVAIGNWSRINSDNQFVLGGNTEAYRINDIRLGEGAYSDDTTGDDDVYIQPTPKDGIADLKGASLYLRSGAGTGNEAHGGGSSLIFQTAGVSSSVGGTTTNPHVTRGYISNNGSFNWGTASANFSISSTGEIYNNTSTITLRNQTYTLPNAIGIGVLADETGGGALTWKGVSHQLFNHFADANNSGTSETDLYSDAIPGTTLAANGAALKAQYGGIFTGAATATQRLRAYIGGTLIFDSGALSVGVATDSWDLVITMVRAASNKLRCTAHYASDFTTLNSSATFTEVTLTLSSTQTLKITGTAAGAAGGSNQITAKEGIIELKPVY